MKLEVDTETVVAAVSICIAALIKALKPDEKKSAKKPKKKNKHPK